MVNIKQPILVFFSLILLWLFNLATPPVASPKIDFYFFNPDSSQPNFSALKKSIEGFFQQTDCNTTFQAFSQKVDFDRMVKKTQPPLVYVPDWYYQHYGKQFGLEPFLKPVHDGKTSYTKTLLVRKNSSYTLNGSSTKTVAMTTMGPDTEKKFLHIFQNEYGVDLSKSNIIITPKDVDAFYALALGQVDAALVGMDTLNAVRDANQRIAAMVKEVAHSEPLPMPLLCVTKGKLERGVFHRLKQIFQESSNQPTSPLFMQMLRIDDWETIN